ncbi:Arginine/ornithine antiporter ArcD [hydrothermal vent metagenome]|uniref:Arginine/ornithine antiporter ArcD n=1 Tax=hydrothermal vent metagenome TaxID=652676 RepID=A0A1W1EGB9_9ZZZZ
MTKVKVRLALLALLLPFLLNATNILKDDILKPEAAKLVNVMADELALKTGVNGYVVATNENFPERFNLVEYSKKYEANMSKPYVVLIFAPNAIITVKSEAKGRVAIIPSSVDISKMYDKSDVEDATIDVIAAKDKNTKEDKYNIGVVQGFSELADQIANSKNIELTTTLPNETRFIIGILQIIVLVGAALVFWMFIFRPLYLRIKNGKEK